MYLYCEKSLYDMDKGSHEVILDFHSKEDMYKVLKSFRLNQSKNTKTLLLLKGLKFEKYRGFRGSSWYELPIEFFDSFVVSNEMQDNSRIVAELTYSSNRTLDLIDFRKTKADKIKDLYLENTDNQSSFKETKFYEDFKDENKSNKNNIGLELIVRNVGCGNWNEIISPIFWIIYDLGGDIKFSSQDMDDIFSEISFSKPFIGIISHWDLDHYRGILDLKSSDLSLMKYIVVPSKQPNTLQNKKTLNRLSNFNIPIYTISRANKTNRYINLVSQGKFGEFELFRSCDGSNINQSGIVLTIEGNEKIAVLTGDHHYHQLYNAIFAVPRNKPYELVVPHHGGNAGMFDKNIWNKVHFSGGAMSTLSGRYANLPKYNIHKYFVDDTSFHCTDCHSIKYSCEL